MLRKSLFISFLFVAIFAFCQDWDFTVTDANMTIQISSDVVFLDGEEPPLGSLLGAFYINDSGGYSCAGYQEWIGDQLAIALWSSESGADNGFLAGESINWFIQVDGNIYEATISNMNETSPFSPTFIPNGFGQVLSLYFYSSGCSDNTACNYCDSCVEFDDDLCEYPDQGYNCDGTCISDSDGDGICDELEIPGCTDELAANYNSNATDDDNSCEYILYGCTNELASNFNILATDDDSSCIFCSDVNASNYYSGSDGSFCEVDEINNYTLENESDGLLDCCFYLNPGCTDDGSCFDADGDGDLDECDDRFLYINDLGESVYYQSPFPGVSAANYNPSANVLIGVNYCYYFPACQDQSAMNYGYNCAGEDILSLAQSYGFSVDFNEDPGNSSFTIVFNDVEISFASSENCCLYYGCDDPNADNFHDIDGVFYQNLPEEENYYPNGNINFNNMFSFDGTYEVLDQDLPSWANVVSVLLNDDIDGDGVLNSVDPDPDNDDLTMLFQYSGQIDLAPLDPCVYLGCTDGGFTENGDGLIAYNYNPLANVDDGSCEYYVCEDPNSMNYMDEEDVSDNASYSYCSEIDFYNNQTYVPIPDGLNDCCQYLGCLDPMSVNYNPNASIEELVFTASNQGSSVLFSPIPVLSNSGDTIGYENTCYPYIWGCMDPIAENYNDYDQDGESNLLVEDVQTIYQLLDININENGAGLFGIDAMDVIEEFNLSGNNINVNTQVALDENGLPIPNGDINSVNPCEYIYGCTDPCYVEYYDFVDYSDEGGFSFVQINSFLNTSGCDFNYNYGCTELIMPNPSPTFDDGSCTNLLVYGCMDPVAANYNPNATINDCLSCIPSILIDFNVVNPMCYNDMNGVFSWSVSGGIPPYNYYLFNGSGDLEQTGQLNNENVVMENNLAIGNYFLEVFDSENYNASVSFPVIESPEFIIDLWSSGGWLNTVEGYDFYNWTLNGDPLIGDEFLSNQILPNIPGFYGVTASFEYDNGLCVSNTSYLDFDGFAGISENNGFIVNCIPNPFIDQAIVQIDNTGSEELKIDLYDGFGKRVWRETRLINTENSFLIDNLTPGIYYFRVTSLNEVKVIPIMVLK